MKYNLPIIFLQDFVCLSYRLSYIIQCYNVLNYRCVAKKGVLATQFHHAIYYTYILYMPRHYILHNVWVNGLKVPSKMGLELLNL